MKVELRSSEKNVKIPLSNQIWMLAKARTRIVAQNIRSYTIGAHSAISTMTETQSQGRKPIDEHTASRGVGGCYLYVTTSLANS